jgi:putative membrane protein
MKFTLRSLYGTAALALVWCASAANDEAGFIAEAIQGNLAEVQLGELAMQRAERADVRKFGERLRDDHSAALKRATSVARSLDVPAPTEAPTEAKRHYNGLAQLSGAEFDAAFLSHMVVAHEAEIANYSSNASSDNDALAAFVAEAMPTLRTHLATAQALQRGPLSDAR